MKHLTLSYQAAYQGALMLGLSVMLLCSSLVMLVLAAVRGVVWLACLPWTRAR